MLDKSVKEKILGHSKPIYIYNPAGIHTWNYPKDCTYLLTEWKENNNTEAEHVHENETPRSINKTHLLNFFSSHLGASS